MLLAGLLAAQAAAQSGPLVLHAWVDPTQGVDATAAVQDPGAPFRTIQTAAGALVTAGAGPSLHGVIHLLPGRYGFGPAPLNGERWPVIVPPHVSLVGMSALSVMFEGQCTDPTTPAFALAGVDGIPEAGRPILAFAGGGSASSLVARVTFVAGDRGVWIGNGAAPTLAFCAFLGCRIGVQVHSEGPGAQPAPRILNCTFGANDVGLAVTALGSGGFPVPSSAVPALVNCLLRNTRDLEGVAADSVVACAFSVARVNDSPFLVQPPEPTGPVFDPWSHAPEDLFLGALVLPPGLPPAQRVFTDWRLTQRVTSTALPNPAIGSGTGAFPLTLANGTTVVLALPAESLGAKGCAGGVSPGPLAPSAPGWGLGYDPGGSFHVGGTMPLTEAFGTALNGVSFRTLHLFHGEPALQRLLLSTFCPGAPEYPVGSSVPRGILAQPLQIAGVSGPFHLDLAASCQGLDLSAAMSPQSQGSLGGVAHWTVALGPALHGLRAGLNLQVVYIDAFGAIRCSNAEHVNLEL